jgi:hypothetical protein
MLTTAEKREVKRYYLVDLANDDGDGNESNDDETDCKKKRHECRKTAYFFGKAKKTKIGKFEMIFLILKRL